MLDRKFGEKAPIISHFHGLFRRIAAELLTVSSRTQMTFDTTFKELSIGVQLKEIGFQMKKLTTVNLTFGVQIGWMCNGMIKLYIPVAQDK